MGIPFTVTMGFLLTMTMGFLFTMTLGIQLTISTSKDMVGNSPYNVRREGSSPGTREAVRSYRRLAIDQNRAEPDRTSRTDDP